LGAKTILLTTLGFFVAMPVILMIFIFSGLPMRGGTEGIFWFFFGGSALTLLTFFDFSKRKSTTKVTARQILTLDPSITLEEGINLVKRYSFLMLVSSILFFVGGIVTFFMY
jgi:hypothetical protein